MNLYNFYMNKKSREWTWIIKYLGGWIVITFFLFFFVLPPAETIAKFLNIEEWEGIVQWVIVFFYLSIPTYWIPKYYKKRDTKF